MNGKLKQTLKERCPDCGKVLQVRETYVNTVRHGIPVVETREFICCSSANCGYERGVEPKRMRRQEEI